MPSSTWLLRYQPPKAHGFHQHLWSTSLRNGLVQLWCQAGNEAEARSLDPLCPQLPTLRQSRKTRDPLFPATPRDTENCSATATIPTPQC